MQLYNLGFLATSVIGVDVFPTESTPILETNTFLSNDTLVSTDLSVALSKHISSQICHTTQQPWHSADQDCIWEGIQYLETGNRTCRVKGGSFERVSCSWNSAIFLCNDNDFDVVLSCSVVGNYAHTLDDACVDLKHGVVG